MRRWPQILCLLVNPCLCSLSDAQTQQTGKIERNTSLRRDASSAHPPIRILSPSEEVRLLSTTKVNNYYNVATDSNEQGWVYAANVTLDAGPPTGGGGAPAAFPDAHDAPPRGWTGPVFKLSQNYPQTAPAPDQMPWKGFDFKTQSAQYLRTVLDYAKDGNIQVDWRGDLNTVRKWYHAPWLHTSNAGREYVHGLTRERSSRPRELHPAQASTFANYAVGMYNAPGGFTIGRVWKDPENPDASAARFADGSVAVKLLFTTATVAEVPYLTNAFEWDAHISDTGSSTTRRIAKVRLLQIDVAVRDSRADNTTGWVFGTFSYDGTATGATPWDRMRPVGLMWGNDPTLTPTRFNTGQRVRESVIINPVIGAQQHLGWLGRLNGPVDNPRSSCLSCHSTAQHAEISGPLPSATATDQVKMRWFRNIKAGNPFDRGQISLDYSLQLSAGIKRFMEERRPPDR
jgi:hypothetical protein